MYYKNFTHQKNKGNMELSEYVLKKKQKEGITYGEVAEAYESWRKKKDDLGEELADVAIYLLGLSEILGIDLEDEIQKKVYKNSKREYKVIDGVNTRVKEFEDNVER